MNSLLSEYVSHPELESRMKVYGNEYSARARYLADRTSLDVLEVHPDRAITLPDMGYEQFAEYCGAQGRRMSASGELEYNEPLLRIFFVEELFIPPTCVDAYSFGGSVNDLPTNMDDSTAFLFNRYFGVPMLFLQDLIPVITYRTIGNATFVRRDREGRKVSIDGYYQFCSDYMTNRISYAWYSQSLVKGRASNYVIHKCPHIARTLIFDCAYGTRPLTLTRPFAVDAFLMNNCVMHMNNELIKPREQLITVEQNPTELLDLQSDQQVRNVTLLHSISREFRLMRDTLYSVKETLEYLFQSQKKLANLVSSSPQGPTDVTDDGESIAESFSILISKANWISRELESLEDRAKLKIDYEYTIENQRDSRTNLHIASLTTNIAAASQKDSSSMITMTAVTMFFLPGTFVSAIFSMVFFTTSNSGKFHASPLWWIFVAITVPLTVLVFAVWTIWRRKRNIDSIKELENLKMQDSETKGVEGEGMVNNLAKPEQVPSTATSWLSKIVSRLFSTAGRGLRKQDRRAPPSDLESNSHWTSDEDIDGSLPEAPSSDDGEKYGGGDD